MHHHSHSAALSYDLSRALIDHSLMGPNLDCTGKGITSKPFFVVVSIVRHKMRQLFSSGTFCDLHTA
jgi:hypothetical protein